MYMVSLVLLCSFIFESMCFWYILIVLMLICSVLVILFSVWLELSMCSVWNLWLDRMLWWGLFQLMFRLLVRIFIRFEGRYFLFLEMVLMVVSNCGWLVFIGRQLVVFVFSVWMVSSVLGWWFSVSMVRCVCCWCMVLMVWNLFLVVDFIEKSMMFYLCWVSRLLLVLCRFGMVLICWVRCEFLRIWCRLIWVILCGLMIRILSMVGVVG